MYLYSDIIHATHICHNLTDKGEERKKTLY